MSHIKTKQLFFFASFPKTFYVCVIILKSSFCVYLFGLETLALWQGFSFFRQKKASTGQVEAFFC